MEYLKNHKTRIIYPLIYCIFVVPAFRGSLLFSLILCASQIVLWIYELYLNTNNHGTVLERLRIYILQIVLYLATMIALIPRIS